MFSRILYRINKQLDINTRTQSVKRAQPRRPWLQEEKIDENVVRSMRAWPHSGFSIDNSVRITADDMEGMQRLVSYISRCPFSLARMIKVSADGQVIYRAGKSECVRFPRPGDERLRQGVSRNFQVFNVLDSLPSSCLAMGRGDAAHTE